MKKHFIIISLLFVFGNCYGEGSDPRSNFDKAVDYLNCKMIENSLSAGHYDMVKFGKKCKCETIPSYNTISTSFETKNNFFTNTKKLSEAIDSFKKMEESSLSLNFLTGGIFNNYTGDGVIVKFRNEREKEGLDKFKNFIDNIRPDIKNILECGAIKCDKPTHTGIDSNIVSFVNATIEKELVLIKKEIASKISIPLFILGAIILIVIYFGAYFLFNRSRRRKHSSTSDKIETSLPQDLSNLESRIIHIEGDITLINDYSNKINELENTIKQLKEQQKNIIQAIQKQPASPQAKTNSSSYTASSSPNVISELYFPAPDEEGTFDNTTGSPQYKDGKSIYKFELTGTKEALFSIDPRENAILMALKFPEVRIYKVCEQIDGTNPHDAKTIVTVEKGQAYLIDNKWRLINTAKIRFS